MKRTKRIFAIFMTLALAMSMLIVSSAVSFAADGDKTITLTGGKAGHTYTLYQIFTGKVENGQLTNIQWGANAPDSMKTGGKTAAAAAKEISTQNDARAFAKSLNLTGDGLGKKTLAADGNVVFENVPEGYYVIIDTNGNETVTENDYSSAIIVEVVEDVNGALKGDAPTSEKKVDDKNDSDTSQDAITWEDSADYDIGDAVPFQLKATTASNVAMYKKYHITFQDKQSDGLDAPETFTITVPGTQETLSLSYSATEAVTKTVTFGSGESAVAVNVSAQKVTPDEGRTFAIKVTFEAPEGKLLPAALNDQDILVHYSSVLNTNAKIGSEGNPNQMYIKYSSNPESTDDSEEGKTPDDKVIVFTYKFVVDKTDETGTALKGAGFTLSKKQADGTYAAVGSEVKGSDLTTFVWKGLDDGEYKLEETTVPDGYTKAQDITFKVVATHDPDNANPALQTLVVQDVTPSTATFTVDKDAGDTDAHGNIYTGIANKSGATLPETGGIGTIIFYVLGSLLVVGCGIVLISKRRMESR